MPHSFVKTYILVYHSKYYQKVIPYMMMLVDVAYMRMYRCDIQYIYCIYIILVIYGITISLKLMLYCFFPPLYCHFMLMKARDPVQISMVNKNCLTSREIYIIQHIEHCKHDMTRYDCTKLYYIYFETAVQNPIFSSFSMTS